MTRIIDHVASKYSEEVFNHLKSIEKAYKVGFREARDLIIEHLMDLDEAQDSRLLARAALHLKEFAEGETTNCILKELPIEWEHASAIAMRAFGEEEVSNG
jgi:hypothetical protein